MTFKKSFSVFMALMLIFGILVPCFPVMGTENDPHSHTYGDWVFDTEKGTQSKTCSCGDAITLHGTDNKVSQVTEPVIGESYYLAANVAGKVYFFRHGTISDTQPYSLVTTDNVNHNWAFQVTLEAPVEGNTGFQMTYQNPTNGATTRIYCYDVLTTAGNSGIMDTGANTANYLNRHTFFVDEVGGIKVLRKIGNNNILVVKYNATKGEYRMLGVPEAELANEGVYPAMLVNVHTHSYGTTYEHNSTQHWQVCECGSTSAPADHDFVMNETLGYGVCVCGADQKPHECASTDGVWYAADKQHYQLCGECLEPFNKAEHTYGTWSFDTQKGTQSRTCPTCDYEEILHGTDNKVSQVAEPVIGGSYYLVANVNGQLLSFLSNGGYTETSPYSLKTTTTLSKVTLIAALESGKGEFQLVDETGKYIYSIDAGAGATTSVNYIHDPQRVSFSMDQVGGVPVIRAFGTQNVLVAKYSDTKSAWRIWCLPEAELANEGVYPVMLANAHTHSFDPAVYGYSTTQHWHVCACGSTSAAEDHDFVMNETLGYGVCVCGADQRPHQCENTDGVWYEDGAKHYQLCGSCGEKINTADHTYGEWVFDTEKGMQTRACSVGCGSTETLYGTDTKVSEVTAPVLGESYYLAANVAGTVYFFRHGKVTDTVPYSLVVTDTISHNWCFKVTLESSMETDEKFEGGFQLVYTNPESGAVTRIYCFDAGGSDGIMDTGVNSSTPYKNRHSFFVDDVNGVKVLRKYGNDNILVVKYDESVSAWRMLGVPESELAAEGVYPVMLANAHTHSYTYDHSSTQHWQVCDCGKTTAPENHSYVKDEATGDEICLCGAVLQQHDCASTDGKWYEEDGKHYQLCGLCGKRFHEGDHTYGAWEFDTQKFTQSRSCTACAYVETLYGTDTKVSQVAAPTAGESYYLAANVAGKVYFFRHGTVTDTSPVSLVTTDNVNHNWAFTLTVEAPIEGNVGFQMTYTHPTTGNTTRIYCYDSVGKDGVMDTGANSTNELAKHTFFVDEIGGVKVLRKVGNNHILVVKYNESVGAWRMLGVPESELGAEGVYPAMLVNVHAHSYTDATYQSNAVGHWYTCQCGGKSNYAEHTAEKWEITKAPTETTPGSKTGVCTVCGATAIVEIPPVLPDGYYYLTGTLEGVKYYFCHAPSGGSVTSTTPYSLYTTVSGKANEVNVTMTDGNYNVFYGSNLHFYINGSGVGTTTQVNRKDWVDFQWDPVHKTLYQMEGTVKYVLAFRKMTNTKTNQQEVRITAVPEKDLSAEVAVAQLEVIHQHSYSQKWNVDAIYHWKECDCGTRTNEGLHQVEQWTVEKEATAYAAGVKSGVCSQCGEKIVNAIPMLTDNVITPENGGKYYLTAVLNGTRYYFRNAPAGGSVTTTTPYSLYADDGSVMANMVTVKKNADIYKLTFGTEGHLIYINVSGVGTTSKSGDKALVDFQWDAENKLLYQDESGVKHVLVFKVMKNSKTGVNEVRITAMPMEQALVDPTVGIARFSTEGPAPVEKEKDSFVLAMPDDATAIKTLAQEDAPVEVLPQDDAISPKNPLSKEQDSQNSNGLLLAGLLGCVILAAIIVALMLMKNTKFGLWFFGKWNLWTAAAFVIAAAVLVTGMVLSLTAKTETLSLSQFTIVANAGNLDTAEELAVTIYEKHGISLPVVQSKDYQGNMGIYLDTQGFNSYGGYKYSVYSEDNEYGPGIYINGSGASLETAISKWLKSLKDPTAFPFGLQETISGYEWNTDDINMTGLGFSLKETERTELDVGVELRKLTYESFGYGKVTGYAVIVDSDADVELKVAAGQWDENTTTDNPGTKHTVAQYGKMLTEDGYEVLAITNAGFYDLNTTMTYIPWGLQIVDGYVRKEPSEENPNNTDNWFGQTADGKYVISNTAGYFETYETTLAQGVGGGRVLMKDGKPCFSTTGADYRTVVGITKAGDLIILTMPSANYAFVTQIYMDLDMDVDCILNLDGGGSTTLHSLNGSGVLTQMICETPIEREVADAIAIVKKK